MSRPCAIGLFGVGVIGLALSSGCTAGDPSPSPREAALLFRTGAGCAQGCANDRPLLAGTEEIADVIGVVDLDSMLVAVDDVSIATAWVEPVRMCCDASTAPGACRPMSDAELECAGQVSEQPRVVVRALRAGRTSIQIGDDGGEVAWEPVEVEDAADVVAIADPIDRDRLDGDVVARPWIDGRVDRIALRAGTTERLRFVAHDAQGRALLASRGISARIDDPRIAEIGPAHGTCDGAIAEGEAIAIEGVAQGGAALEVRAGRASATIGVDVGASCDDRGEIVLSDDACESDADCAPVECCHASACGAVASAPICEGVACTLECREGTIDCGGSCLCVEGRCAAYIPGPHDPRCDADAPPPIPTPPLPPPF